MEMILFGLCLLLVGIILIKTGKRPILGKIMISIVAALGVTVATLFCFVLVAFGSVNSDILTVLVCIVGFILFFTIIGFLWGFIKQKKVYIPVIVLTAVCLITMAGINIHQFYVDSIPTVGEGSNVLYRYSPFMADSHIATLNEESTLKITENFPIMDGATALYPVYAAFAKAVYPKEMFENPEGWNKYDNDYLCCSTTAHAYERIVTGEADIIFVASPSKEQAAAAESLGVELVFTPIGKEAFVFFVNSQNPIESIDLEDVQKIYTGELTRWSELGVKGLGKIRAFQREEGSGSQSTLVKLMAGKTLMTPPKEDVISGMGGIITRTADYKNYKNAIGYSFRFYSTEMVENNMIKLLKINGVAPKLESIENGTYPIVGDFYAVTRSDADENTLKLLNWIQNEEGQSLIEKTGYTPLYR